MKEMNIRVKQGEKGYCVMEVNDGKANYFSEWKDAVDYIEMLFGIE